MRIGKPLSKEQLKQGDLIEPGIYDFEVIDAEEAISKSGNEMLKLKLKVWDSNGRERILFDYLLESLEWKIGHFAECTGLFDKYQEGVLSANDCIGKSGQCKVYIQVSKDPQYGDKNSIADYMLTDEQSAAKVKRKAEAASVDFVDDQLPF
jgi:hypothetical protein